MRLSLMKAAHVAVSSAAGTLRSRNISTKGPRNCRSLGFPGFPVESCGFGQQPVVLLRENHISGAGESCEVGNPGTLGMTKCGVAPRCSAVADGCVDRRMLPVAVGLATCFRSLPVLSNLFNKLQPNRSRLPLIWTALTENSPGR